MSRTELIMRRCWQWASSRGAPEVIANVSFTMTPFGRLDAFSIATTQGRAPELVACLQDTLGNITINERSARTTRMHARVAFVRVGDEPWIVQPQRPERPVPLTLPHACIPVLDDVAPDVLESPIVYTVDDSGPRDTRELPFRLHDCSQRNRMPADAGFVTAFESNRGAFETCYADALARNLDQQVRTQRRGAELSGLVELEVQLSGIAKPRNITVRGPGDPEFHECIREAAGELWLIDVSSDAIVTATYRFALAPVSKVQLPDLAARERAIASAIGDGPRCRARADLVVALAAHRPWLDDARLVAETRALAREAASLPHPEACIEDIDKLLEQIAGGLRFDRSAFRWSLRERVEAVLPLANHVDWGFMLRWYHAATIAMDPDRHAEGVALLRGISQTDHFAGALAQNELARYELPHPITPETCP